MLRLCFLFLNIAVKTYELLGRLSQYGDEKKKKKKKGKICEIVKREKKINNTDW